MAREPGDHLGMFVGGIVVEDDVDGLLRWNSFFDGVEEADELLVAMALRTPADHLTFEHVEGSEQRSGAVTLVVMGHGAGATLLHRQTQLGTVQRLDLTLLEHLETESRGRECPFRLKSGSGGAVEPCPFCPQKRTLQPVEE